MSVILATILLLCFVNSIVDLQNKKYIERDNYGDHLMTSVSDGVYYFSYNKATNIFKTQEGEVIWDTSKPGYFMILSDSGYIEYNGNGIKIDPNTGNRIGFKILGDEWEGIIDNKTLKIVDENEEWVELDFNDFIIIPSPDGELSSFSAISDQKFIHFLEIDDIYGVSNFGMITLGIHGLTVYENGKDEQCSITYDYVEKNNIKSLNYSAASTAIIDESGEKYYIQNIIVPTKIYAENTESQLIPLWIIFSSAISLLLIVCIIIQIKWDNND